MLIFEKPDGHNLRILRISFRKMIYYFENSVQSENKMDIRFGLITKIISAH